MKYFILYIILLTSGETTYYEEATPYLVGRDAVRCEQVAQKKACAFEEYLSKQNTVTSVSACCMAK